MPAGTAHLAQVGIRVTNLSRSLRFYRRAFGFQEVRRGDGRGWGGGIWVQLRGPGSHQVLELNWYPAGSRFATRYRSGDALDHLDMTIGPRPRKVLERAVRRALRAGARPTWLTMEASEGWTVGVEDPDGVWLQIYREPTPAERRRR